MPPIAPPGQQESAEACALVPATTIDNELTHDAVASVIRSCNLVFGVTATALAAFGTWLLISGTTRAPIVVAAWAIVAINLVWSRHAYRWSPVAVDLLRGLVSLPISAYLYVADQGSLEKLWIPALMLTVGIALSTGIASRRSLPGILNTIGYAGALFVVGAIKFEKVDFFVINDLLGIGLTGIVTSMISSKLGRMLDEARQQRDAAHQQKDRAENALRELTQRSQDLTVAIEDLHREMEHRIRVESELRQAQKLESVGRLAAGVAHEINTPVQFVSDSVDFVHDSVTEVFGVLDKLEVVERSVLEGVPSRRAAEAAASAIEATDLSYLATHIPRALDRARDGLSRVAKIVQSMKEFAHPDTAEREVVDVNHAIESTLTIARNEYKDIAELEVELCELPPLRCYIGELNQAVLNIVVNAAHAIGDVVAGTGTMGRIRVRTFRDGDDVVIAISDTGNGIPAEIQDRIYDPFFTTKPVGRGTGQGLAVARSVVVDKHHGRLDFETQPGKGTTFLLRLPIDGHSDMELA